MHDNFRGEKVGEKGVDKNTMSLRLRNLIKIDLSTFTKLNINSIDINFYF